MRKIFSSISLATAAVFGFAGTAAIPGSIFVGLIYDPVAAVAVMSIGLAASFVAAGFYFVADTI